MSTSSASTYSSNYSVFHSTTRGRATTRLPGGVLCDCDLEAPCREAWKNGTLDPGRRFVGCSRWRDKRLCCGFFEWVDPPYTERAREMIEMLKEKLAVKADEVMVLMNELERVEARFRTAITKKEDDHEMKENVVAEMKEELERVKYKFKIMTMILVGLVSIVLFVFVSGKF